MIAVGRPNVMPMNRPIRYAAETSPSHRTTQMLRKVCFAICFVAVLLQSACIGPHPSPTNSNVESTAFLTAAIAPLFRDVDDFAARLTVETHGQLATNSIPPLRGELFGQNGHLLFIPIAKEKWRGLHGVAPGVRFLWNSQSNGMFVLNEPLQGYAPVLTSADSVSNSNPESILLGTATLNGQYCQKWLVTSFAGKGAANVFTVKRATALNHFPITIQSWNGLTGLTVTLSNIRLQPLSADLFVVPNAFTRYTDLERITTELMTRQSSMMPRTMGEKSERMPGGPAGGPR